MTIPTMSVPAQQEQATFRALLNAMARPGTVYHLPTPRPDDGIWGGALLVLQALLDHEVTFHVLSDQALPHDQLLRRTGARSASLGRADFVLARGGGAVAAVEEAREGGFEEPERSATVVLVVDSLGGDGVALTLSGPGIEATSMLSVGGVPAAAFESLRRRTITFPEGVDVILVDTADHVAALPRSTRIAMATDSRTSDQKNQKKVEA
ncbi:MAG: phosphonate C-P lyase system protein PhnH [Dehalococcoidia bacterium]|nr:MAG: phosphonate C-P lyase system protein PhnH [Dehalococcoidia bacterium]